MGLLSEGTPLNWPETQANADLIRIEGIQEFIKIYQRYKANCQDSFKWGDEIEFSLLKFDHEKKRVYLLLKAHELIDKLNEKKAELRDQVNIAYHPEYASYMIESTPAMPFTNDLNECFRCLEENMRSRRDKVEHLLGKDEHIVAITVFPQIGCTAFTWPSFSPTPECGITRSLFYPDQAIYTGHPRFVTISSNIRQRRNSKVQIYLPIFKDTNTQCPFVEQLDENFVEDQIYLDATGFGMGCCCLQCTFQAESIDEARFLYDQLTPITPIMLALSASSPIWRGFLSNIDCRWNTISGSVDDRTEEERGKLPLQSNRFRIFKSRYDSIDSYLSKQGERYNDLEMVLDQNLYDCLINNGVDELMAQHIAHLFIRDPLIVFKEQLQIAENHNNNNNDKNKANHSKSSSCKLPEPDNFENIQSTNWQTMRFKPPPFNQDHVESENRIGWRVEFRPIELQFTDFENAAFVSFVILLSKAIKHFNLNFLIPISKVDVNMQRAQQINACLKEKFHFRTNCTTEDDSVLQEMSINEIINGSEQFKGLVFYVRSYIDLIEFDQEVKQKLEKYLRLIEKRADGSLATPASYMRQFVREHPDYKFDSVVSDRINYDLMWHVYQIQNGSLKCAQLYDNLI